MGKRRTNVFQAHFNPPPASELKRPQDASIHRSTKSTARHHVSQAKSGLLYTLPHLVPHVLFCSVDLDGNIVCGARLMK